MVPEVLETPLGRRIRTGEVQSILGQVIRAAGPAYERLVADLWQRRVVNGDETSWRLSGDNPWLWVFITRWETGYLVANGRGREIALGLLRKEFKRTLVRNRHGAYRAFASKTGATQLHAGPTSSAMPGSWHDGFPKKEAWCCGG